MGLMRELEELISKCNRVYSSHGTVHVELDNPSEVLPSISVEAFAKLAFSAFEIHAPPTPRVPPENALTHPYELCEAVDFVYIPGVLFGTGYLYKECDASNCYWYLLGRRLDPEGNYWLYASDRDTAQVLARKIGASRITRILPDTDTIKYFGYIAEVDGITLALGVNGDEDEGSGEIDYVVVGGLHAWNSDVKILGSTFQIKDIVEFIKRLEEIHDSLLKTSVPMFIDVPGYYSAYTSYDVKNDDIRGVVGTIKVELEKKLTSNTRFEAHYLHDVRSGKTTTVYSLRFDALSRCYEGDTFTSGKFLVEWRDRTLTVNADLGMSVSFDEFVESARKVILEYLENRGALRLVALKDGRTVEVGRLLSRLGGTGLSDADALLLAYHLTEKLAMGGTAVLELALLANGVPLEYIQSEELALAELIAKGELEVKGNTVLFRGKRIPCETDTAKLSVANAIAEYLSGLDTRRGKCRRKHVWREGGLVALD